MHRSHSTTVLFILLFLLLTAFAPLYATALPEGRTLDEGHESGYIDWSGPVGYTNFWHRDSLCYSGCFEEVTQLSDGSSVSGSFQSGVDVNYFEVMVARSGAGGFGTAIVTACSSTTSVYLGTGGATPGFNSLSLYVPPGCTSWSLSASGGNVYFRSVDASYSAPSLPPVISGSLACTRPGNGGWCLDGQSLHLEASDPQAQPIIIYGRISGVNFSCPSGATTCDVPVTVQGAGTAEFTVLNPATGLSDSDALSYQLDSSTPQIDLTITGASGLNGWFVSTVTTTASASDAVSGLASLEVAVDGGAWQPNVPLTLNEGMHTVAARAYDVAGNVTESTQNINVDTLTPALNISVNGVAGQNGWYVSQTEVTATATDPGSGLASLEVAVNGGTWQVYSPQTFSDGVHTLQFRATDNAGNVTTANHDLRVDTLTPNLSLMVNGTVGLNGWYVSAVQVSAAATDAGSGTGTLEASVNGGAWSAFSGPLSFTDGVFSYQVQVSDQAGNVTQTPVQSLKVDTIAPLIEMPARITLGKRLEYTLQDDGSGLAIYRAVIEDDAEKYPKIVWLKTLSGNRVADDILWDGKFRDGTEAPPGEYFITLKISDAAGNERMMTTVVKVSLLNSLMPIPPFVPPTSAPEPAFTPQAAPTPSTFGGEPGLPAGQPVGQPTPFTFSVNGTSAEEKPATTQTVSKPSQNTSVPITTGGILWGAASAAAVGYFVLETQKRKEEEEQKRREAAETQQQALAQTFLEDTKPEPKEEKPPRRNKKDNTLTEQERLQAIWDANGAQLYEMKQAELKTAAVQPKKSTVSVPARQNLGNKLPSAGKVVAAPAVKAVRQVMTPAKSAPAPVVSKPAKPSLWNNFTSAVKKVTTPVVNTVKKVVTPVVNIVKKVVAPAVNTVKKVVTPIVNTVKKVVTPIVNTVKKIVTPIVNTVQNVVTSVVNTVKKVVTPVVNTVKKVVTSVANTVKKVITPVVNTVSNVFQEHPAAAWTGAATLTTAAVGTYVMICGVPKFIQPTPPVAFVFQLAGVFSLPVTGWLTTNKKKRLQGILIGILFFGIILSACTSGTPTGTQPVVPMPTGNALCPEPHTNTQASPATQTPIPSMATAINPQSLNSNFIPSSNFGMGFMSGWIDTYNMASNQYLDAYNGWLIQNGYSQEQIAVLDLKSKAILYWQNVYNPTILAQAQVYGLDPAMFKGQMLLESNAASDPVAIYDGVDTPEEEAKYKADGCTVISGRAFCRNMGAVGLMQITSGEIGNVLGKTPEQEALLAQIVSLYNNNGGVDQSSQALPQYEPGKGYYNSYSEYYTYLKNYYPEQYQDFNELALRFVDGRCYHSDTSTGCVENLPAPGEGNTSIQLAAAINANNLNQLQIKVNNAVNPDAWNLIPPNVRSEIMIAAYNGGVSGVGQAVVDTLKKSNGNPIAWSDIANTLEQGKGSYTINWCQAAVYPENAACYASGGNSCALKPVQNDINDIDGDRNTNECVP